MEPQNFNSLDDFFGMLWWLDKGNPIPYDDENIEDLLMHMEELEENAEEEVDEGIEKDGDTMEAACARKIIPAVEIHGKTICTSVSLVEVDTACKEENLEKINLCIDCYIQYANIAPLAKHAHSDAHITGHYSEAPKPVCYTCKKTLYTARPTEVCVTCTGNFHKRMF